MECRALLLFLAHKFGVPEWDAEALVHEAVHSLLLAGTSVDNPRAWLIGAVANASRAYGRRRARMDLTDTATLDSMPEPRSTVDAEAVERRLTIQSILRRIRPAYREVLRMHYLKQLTASEIAARLGTTTGYAEKLIVLALRCVRKEYEVLCGSTAGARRRSE